MFAGLNSVYYMLHYTKTCKLSIQHNCQIKGQFLKKSNKTFFLLKDLQMEKKKVQTFYQYTTGIVLLSVAVSVSIYRDTYRIVLHVSRYVSYWLTVVSDRQVYGQTDR